MWAKRNHQTKPVGRVFARATAHRQLLPEPYSNRNPSSQLSAVEFLEAVNA